MSFGRLFLYERSVGFIFVSANMEQWGMERVRKQQLLEQSIYGVIWSVIFFLPLIGEYFVVSGGLEKEEVRTLVRDSWLGILPFFMLFLLNNYVLVPYFLFKKNIGNIHFL